MRHAVALSGGGAFAAFEIGILRALAQGTASSAKGENLEFDILTGTSAGAFNAAILASKPDLDAAQAIEYLESIWLGRIAGDMDTNGVYRIRGDTLLDPSGWIRIRDNGIFRFLEDANYVGGDIGRRLSNLLIGREPFGRRMTEMFDVRSFISSEPIEQLVRELIPAGRIPESRRRLWIAVTNWASGEPRFFENKDMTGDRAALAVLASAAIPGLFPPVMIDNNPYVDGGVVMNTPLKPAITSGADVIHAVALNPDLKNIPLGTLPATMDTFERVLDITVAGHLKDDIASARLRNSLVGVIPKASGEPYRPVTIHRYAPDIDFGGLLGYLDFSVSRMRELIALGEREARNHDCVKEGCVHPVAHAAPTGD